MLSAYSTERTPVRATHAVSRGNGNGTFTGNGTFNGNGMVNGYGQNGYPILVVANHEQADTIYVDARM
jgi:hypothetical protein